jgi:hypothetical protein
MQLSGYRLIGGESASYGLIKATTSSSFTPGDANVDQ